MLLRRLIEFGLVGVLASCSAPPNPPPIEEEKPKLSLEVSADLTAVNLVLDSPITLSSLQATVSFDPTQIQAGPAQAGANAPTLSLVFDDAARVPGKLVVGLSDLNQNPLPRSGAVARVLLTNSTAGDALNLENVVAIDIFGNRVEVTTQGTTVP